MGNLGELKNVEQKIEYRDEKGNVLDPAVVKQLEGKVSFSTRYETRTRLIDDDGNAVADFVGDVREGEQDSSSFAGTLAEAEEPSTDFGGEASAQPPNVNVNSDLEKEEKVEKSTKQEAEPESDASANTGHGEL